MTLQQLSDILKGFYALQGEAQSITRDDLAKFLVDKGIVIVNEENEKKTGIELIAEERLRGYDPINYNGSDIGGDLLTIQKGIRYAIDTNDERLPELLIKTGALIAAEIDRLQNQTP